MNVRDTDDFNVALQTSSYGGRASEKGKPDLQRRRKKSAGFLQPGREEEEREQDPVQLQGNGVQKNQRQGGEVNSHPQFSLITPSDTFTVVVFLGPEVFCFQF